MRYFSFFIVSLVCWFFLLGCDNFGPNRYEIVTNSKGQIIRIDKKTGAIHVVESGELALIQASATQTLTDRLLKKGGIKKTPQLDTSWKWDYSSRIDADNNNYPVMILREGYKPIKRVGGKILLGWKYTVLNTSPNRSYEVTINYEFVDKDGFRIASDSGSEWVQKENTGTVKSTLHIPSDDYHRILRTSWTLNLRLSWSDEKLKGNRFERAAKICKDNCPYWYEDRLKYLFMDAFDKDGKIALKKEYYPKAWVVAKGLGIKPEERLLVIGEIIEVDFTEFDLPPWKAISGHPRYSELSEEDKKILKEHLRLNKEYGRYSPTKGRKAIDWTRLESDFPEPVTQAKVQEQNQNPPSK